MKDDGDRFERIMRGDVLRSWAADTPLDPRKAITITMRELYELAGKNLEDYDPDADEPVHIPSIPINAREALAMLATTNMAGNGRMYVGYTNDELKVVGGAQIEITVERIRAHGGH
jgi:hypothetical protein